MTKSEVISKIQSFYERENRVPVSKDYRSDYGGSGLPHWNTLKNNFPKQSYDEIIHQALGFKTFKELFSDYVLTKNKEVVFIHSTDIAPDDYWASQTTLTRWLSSQCGKVFCGYYVRLYAGGTREHGYLFRLTKIRSLFGQEVTA